MKHKYAFLSVGFLLSINLLAAPPKGYTKLVKPIQKNFQTLAAGCLSSTASAELDINNVRATILASSDMWWDFNTAKYEVPRGSGVHALFAGGLWIGGKDGGGQLHIAAMNYRQNNGIDFFSGPVDTTNITTTQATCNTYDRLWKVDRGMVEEFKIKYNQSGYAVPKDIIEWPGNGDASYNQGKYLAPYFDNNGDGIYNYLDGDYPGYDFNTSTCNGLKGDQTLWWVFNDVGNAHTETGGSPLGVEVHAQAFAFITNDENNNNTFYEYKVINRSTNTYFNTFFGQWVDADIGSYDDDYVGCDVGRGLGYAYNGDANDGTGQAGTYGNYPAAAGYDLLGGPLADLNDGKDNDHDTLIDEPGERIAMSKFVYYNNDATVTGEPSQGQDYYNYLSGFWKDGLPFTYGGDAYNEPGPICDFMFPGTSDPGGIGTGGVLQPSWSESSVGNTPADRRFLVSAGPFTFVPGAVQTITGAAVWAQTDIPGNNIRAVDLLKVADDKAQKLFDVCFQNPCIPPVATIQSNINELVVSFTPNFNGNSYSWNFGDGQSSTQKFPTHTYSADGTYTVCLIVSNNCGIDITCDTIDVKKYVPPVGVLLQRMEGQGNGGNVIDFIPGMHDSVFVNSQPRILRPVYAHNRGPVSVTVFDSTLLQPGTYVIQLDGVTNSNNWKIFLQGGNDTVHSSSTIGIGNLQVISQWGISIQAKQVPTDKHDFLEASMSFADNSKKWLSGVKDEDFYSPANWIRSGTNILIPEYKDYVGSDNSETFENVINATWAPYPLCGYSTIQPASGSTPLKVKAPGMPAYTEATITHPASLKNLASVDVVITSDKSKWSRCPVLEAQEIQTNSADGVKKLDIRKHKSVDKNGNVGDSVVTNDPNDADYISATGMGWFPGYAINVETGERLNMAFSEDTYRPDQNGNDMLWNPTSAIYDTVTAYSFMDSSKWAFYPLFGGRHYIYIFNHNGDAVWPSNDANLPNEPLSVPRYDAGKALSTMLKVAQGFITPPKSYKKREILKDAIWVNMPLLATGRILLETDVHVRLRVKSEYDKAFSGGVYLISPTTPPYTAKGPSKDTLLSPFNKNYPLYQFTTNSLSIGVNKTEKSNVLKLYPNPFSSFAELVFSNPGICDVNIYSITGMWVRSYANVKGEKITIERGSLNTGVYFYHITNTKGDNLGLGKMIVE